MGNFAAVGIVPPEPPQLKVGLFAVVEVNGLAFRILGELGFPVLGIQSKFAKIVDEGGGMVFVVFFHGCLRF